MKSNVESGDYPDALTIRHVAMVGARAETMQFYRADQMILRGALSAAGKLGLSLSSAFDTFAFDRNLMPGRDITRQDASLIRTINIDPVEGGEDFLNPAVITNTDLLVFCNIPHAHSEHDDYLESLTVTFRGKSEDEIDLFALSGHQERQEQMRVSPYNQNDAAWLSQIDASGAKIAYFQNVMDDYPPERLAGDAFVCVKDKHNSFRGLAVRRDFLDAAAKQLAESDGPVPFSHPLIKLAGVAQNSDKNVFSLAFTGRDNRTPVFFHKPW